MPVEDEPLRQDRSREHLAPQLDLRSEPLEGRQPDAKVVLVVHPHAQHKVPLTFG